MKNNAGFKKKLIFATLVIVFVSISLFIAIYPSEKILYTIGIENAYLLMFCLAAIGGMSTFTGVPYHFLLMSFASGGLNPIILGVTTASGVMLGDSFSYILGRQGRTILPKRFKKPLMRVGNYLSNHPRYLIPFLFTYGAISPFSNDFIVISMGLIEYSYWRIILPLTMGNIIYNTTLAYIGYYSFDTVQRFFN